MVFVNNCIVLKVQEFMYKNTVVVTSAPQRETENRRKAPGCGLERVGTTTTHTTQWRVLANRYSRS